jgi:hypothetical protein
VDYLLNMNILSSETLFQSLMLQTEVHGLEEELVVIE